MENLRCPTCDHGWDSDEDFWSLVASTQTCPACGVDIYVGADGGTDEGFELCFDARPKEAASPTPAELLRAGRWSVVPGARAVVPEIGDYGIRLVAENADGWWFGVPDGADGPRDEDWWDLSAGVKDADDWDEPLIGHWAPDPSDPATRLLMLAELARRVGLDPEWGVAWQPNRDAGNRVLGWVLSRGLFSSEFHGFVAEPVDRPGFTHTPGIDTTDPLEALLLAGAATAGEEP